MSDATARLADALARGMEAGSGQLLMFGRVRSVNTDGTLSVETGPGLLTSVRAVASYSPRAVGDSVLVVVTAAGPVVQGAVGAPTSLSGPGFTLSDSAAPAGQGWEETVAGQVWVKPSGAQWHKRVVAAPPPSGGTVSQTAAVLLTYRAGGQIASGKAEQGDYTGRGLCTGLATFGSWAALSGQTPTGGTLTIHRRAGGHGFTYGLVTAVARKCVASGAPGSPPVLGAEQQLIQVALNETKSVPLSAAWCLDYATGAATAVGFYSGNPRDNIEIDAVTLAINY